MWDRQLVRDTNGLDHRQPRRGVWIEMDEPAQVEAIGPIRERMGVVNHKNDVALLPATEPDGVGQRTPRDRAGRPCWHPCPQPFGQPGEQLESIGWMHDPGDALSGFLDEAIARARTVNLPSPALPRTIARRPWLSIVSTSRAMASS